MIGPRISLRPKSKGLAALTEPATGDTVHAAPRVAVAWVLAAHSSTSDNRMISSRAPPTPAFFNFQQLFLLARTNKDSRMSDLQVHTTTRDAVPTCSPTPVRVKAAILIKPRRRRDGEDGF